MYFNQMCTLCSSVCLMGRTVLWLNSIIQSVEIIPLWQWMGRIFIHDLEIIFILSYKGQNLSKAHQGDTFMEQNMRFGLILGRLAILKKKWGRLLASPESGFFMFSWAKKHFDFSKKHCSVRTKKLHYISFMFLNLMYEKLVGYFSESRFEHGRREN